MKTHPCGGFLICCRQGHSSGGEKNATRGGVLETAGCGLEPSFDLLTVGHDIPLTRPHRHN